MNVHCIGDGVIEKELRYTKGLVETLRTRIVKSEQEALKLKIRVRGLETKVKEMVNR